MKRLAAALVVCGAVLGGAASAQAQDYPPANNPVAAVSDPTPDPGASFTVTITNCTAGETVTFAFQGQSATATCSAGGTAVAQLAAPSTAGTYSGTATLASGTVVTFTVTVAAAPTTTAAPVGDIPATGSGSTGTTLTIAGVLLAAGVGMFLVAQLRRREATTA